jgi:hypothetical protein
MPGSTLGRMAIDLELAACTPVPVNPAGFNRAAVIPYGLTIDHIATAMAEFTEYLGFINSSLHGRGIGRLETTMMSAGFSSMVGEYMSSGLPRFAASVVKNNHHNGHPDMLPAGMYPGDDILHGTEGIEIKASRYTTGWQGHNPERTWLMVYAYASSRPTDVGKRIAPQPFRFIMVVGAQLEREDWHLQGRNEGSRRTITAGVLDTGRAKMIANWLYQDPGVNVIPTEPDPADLGLVD